MNRAVCYRCRKAHIMCYCHELRPFISQPEFIILIHPKEARKAINTGRMASLMLTNASLIEGCDFTDHTALNQKLHDPDRRCVLLFPGPAAEDISLIQAGVKEEKGKRWTFIILDGTWAMAHKMYRTSTNLKALPQVMFLPPSPSRYSIRQQPKAHCYATIETIHHIIDLMGYQVGGEHHQLLRVFNRMVEKQLAFEARNDDSNR